MIRNIECKECGIQFKHEFDMDELRGSRKRYCGKCVHIKKIIAKKEAERKVINKTTKDVVTKKVVVIDAIKLILDLNTHLKVTEKSTKTYDKIINILPDKYVTRHALRRQYQDILKNEGQ